MLEILTSLLSFAFLVQVLRITVPYALAALGGVMSERSGVINIALEGKLLVGAFCCAVGAIESGSVAVGALCGVMGGVLVAALALLGLSSFLTMPRAEDPQFDFPFVSIVVSYPGTSPFDMETLIADRKAMLAFSLINRVGNS